MSVEKQGTILSLAAGAATTRYRFGKRSAVSPQTAINCTVAGEAADGVIRNTVTAAGDAVGLMVDGISFCEVGVGGITTTNGKANVTTDNVGRAVAATTGDAINGIALQDGVEGDFIPVQYVENTPKATA